jgi:hypothetical protein
MTRNDLSGYEQRLLGELRTLVEERAAHPAALPTPLPTRRRRPPRLVLAGAAACALAIAAVAVTAGGDGAGTAYAVERQGDGSVTVEISRLEDAAGLERGLREHGIAAEVDYLPAGMTCRERFITRAGEERGRSSVAQSADGATTFTIGRDDVREGQTLVITSSSIATPDGGQATSIAMSVADGAVPPCDPVKAPAGAPGEAIPALPGDAAGR